MRSAPTGAAEDTATPDILANMAAFGALPPRRRTDHRARSSPTQTGVTQFDDFLARQGMPRTVGVDPAREC